MALRKKNDPDAPIIDPKIFRTFFRNVSERTFLLFARKDLEKFIRHGDYSEDKEQIIGSLRYFPGRGRGDFGLAGPVVGAPAAVIALEFLVALGSKEVVCFGSCGSIDPRFRIGDVLVPMQAISEEGTSPLYIPNEDRFAPSARLSARLVSTLEKEGVHPRTATCWTTDAFFRETPAKARRFREEGASVVDMEASALFAVAACRGIELASVFVVSDELFDGKWKPGFPLPGFRLSRRRCVKALQKLRPD